MQNIWFSAVLLLCVGGVGAVTISQAKKMVQFQCGEWKKKSVLLIGHRGFVDVCPLVPRLVVCPLVPRLVVSFHKPGY